MRRRLDPPTFDELASIAADHGLDRVGVAPAAVLERARTALVDRQRQGYDGGMGFTFRNPERSTDPHAQVPEARSLFVAARSYALDAPPAPSDEPTGRVARYAWVDHYGALRRGLRAVGQRIKASGGRAVTYVDENWLVDREAAYLAGLGWYGKNANLLISGLGSWFVLGTVVTTLELPVSPGPVRDGCGPCTRCLDNCPTGAIVAPGVIDANRCLSWVLQKPGSIPDEFRAVLGDRIYGCDDCQDACPPTVHLSRRRPGAVPDGEQIEAWVPLLDVLAASDAELLERHGRWYLAGRDPRWLRRNALVALGNSADSADRRVTTVLDDYAAGDDDLLAEHARWALGRLGAVAATAGSGGRR